MTARESQARYQRSEKGKATARRYAESEKGHARLRRVNQRRLDDPRQQARKAVQNAIRDGRLVKAPCWCGEPLVDGHHANGYDGEHRLEVVWLCRPHHIEVHKAGTP